jgi:lipopolysaccharide transport system ATP-binding protein
MGNIAISVEHLGKRYRIGQAEHRPKSFREAARSFLGAPFHYLCTRFREPTPDEILWALKDVSFEVKHGEVLGVIGRNGAGKSTLLKILSRITEPSEGQACVYGRIGSLLEVGTGFHPELTGRENIYLNGTILGMRRLEIGRKFDEIVEFAEIEKFIDTPVKRYSSGMYVRLAFAVAAHLEPEILLVDEVLAVGDVMFQKKCLGKMEDIVEGGRAILFVSHNMTAVQTLCHRAIWLDEGLQAQIGEVDSVIPKYLQTFTSTTLEKIWDKSDSAPGNDKIKVHCIRVFPENKSTNNITVHTPLKIEFEFWNFVPNAYLNVSLELYTLENVCVFNSPSESKVFSEGLVRGTCHIPIGFLNDETYRVAVMVVKDRSFMLYNFEEAAIFDVHDVERHGTWLGKWRGVIRPELEWSINAISQ